MRLIKSHPSVLGKPLCVGSSISSRSTFVPGRHADGNDE